MNVKVFARPAGQHVKLYTEGEGPNFAIKLDIPSADRLANELKDALKEAREWLQIG